MGNDSSKSQTSQTNKKEIFNSSDLLRPLSSCYDNFNSNSMATYAMEKDAKMDRKEHDLTVQKLLSEIDIKNVKELKPFKGKYIARVIDVHDGDSLKAIIFNDFGMPIVVEIRLYGADAFEITKKTVKKRAGETDASLKHREEISQFVKELGVKGKAEALRFIGASGILDKNGNPPPNGKKTQDYFVQNYISVILEVIDPENKDSEDDQKGEKEKFGRLLSKVLMDEKSLTDHLISKKLAIPYYGKTKSQEEVAEEMMMTEEKSR